MTNEELRALVDSFADNLSSKYGYAYSSGYLSSLLGSILLGWYGPTLDDIKEKLNKDFISAQNKDV
jgi:hypothetical protein